MKTPEEMAEEYANDRCGTWEECENDNEWEEAKRGFLAGYKAAKDEYKAAIDTYNDVAKQMMEEAVRIMSPKDQLADASKVMCNTTIEEVKAVDTGELMPITNLPTSAKWISVKDRLPEEGEEVLVFGQYLNDIPKVLGVKSRYKGDQDWKYTWEGSDEWVYREDDVTHWMPLPEAPKEER